MGFFSDLFKSPGKSLRLKKFQTEIAKSSELEGSFQEMMSAHKKTEAVIGEYIDFCLEDENISTVVHKYGIDKDSLKKITIELSVAGLGQYIQGHYAAYSTIAYVEPLVYYLEAKKKNFKLIDIVSDLMRYWDNEYPQGHLFKKVGIS